MKFKLLLIAFIAFQFAYSQDFKFGKVSKEEILQKEHPLEPSANAAVLYRERKSIFEVDQSLDYSQITEVYERIKIYNKEGYEWATNYANVFKNETISGLKGYTYYIGEDGKVIKIKLGKDGIFEDKISKNLTRKKFTMPDLKEGCVIEFKYSIQSPYFSVEKFRLQEEIPINKIEVNFYALEQLVFKYRKTGWIPFRVKEDQSLRTLGKYGTYSQNNYSVSLSDVPAVKVEAHVGNIDNYISSLKFELEYTKFQNQGVVNYTTTWDQVTRNVYETHTYEYELKKENYFKKDIDELISGVSGQEEKMKRIFKFVKSKMNWNSYNNKYTYDGVKEAYAEGVGNSAEINLMLTAMLRYAKLNANPILVSSVKNGIPAFPTENGFNYVISGVEFNNTVYLLDATNKKSEINILDTRILNWQGRMIKEDGSSKWVSLIPTKSAVNNTMITASISKELELKGELKSRLTGHYALEAREEYSDITEDDIVKKIEKDKGELEVSNVKMDNIEVLDKPISISYNFDAFDQVEEIGDKLYFSPILFIGKKENPFKLEERNYPIEYEYPTKVRAIINIEIPEGYTVEALPENANFGISNNAVTLKYNISTQGKIVKFMVEFSINETYIPVEQYKNLKGYYQLLIEKLNEKVVLKKA
mgnify:CR=1 FL=1